MRALRALFPIAAFFLLIGLPIYAVGARMFAWSPLGIHLHPFLKATLLFTLNQAGLSLLASVVVGVAMGCWFSNHQRSASIRGLLLASFSLPSLAVVGVGVIVARKFGYGLVPIVFAHAYLNAPWIALAVMDGIETFPSAWRDSARSLGASSSHVVRRLVFPWVAVRVALAALQVFAFCVMSFTLVLLLGGGPASGTLETEIYAAVRGGGLDLGAATQFAILQIALAGLPVLLGSMLEIPNADAVDTEMQLQRTKLRTSPFPVLFGLSWFILPLIAVLFQHSPFALLGHLRNLFLSLDFLRALGITVIIASVSALAALLLALSFVFSNWKWVRILGLIPMGVSPLVLCLGYLLAFSNGTLEWIDPFEGSLAAIILIHAVLLLPMGIRFLLPVAKDANQRVRKNRLMAARTLGASPFQAWLRVEWPIWRSAVSDFARIAWVASFGDLAVLSFFGSEKLITVPVLVSRWMSRYEFEAATAALFFVTLTASLVLMVGRGERLKS